MRKSNRFGAQLCNRTGEEWAAAQARDPLAFNTIKYVCDPEKFSFPEMGDDLGDEGLITFEAIQKLASKCDVKKLPRSKPIGVPCPHLLLVKKPTTAPKPSPHRKSGKFARLLGDEPTRVYVPFLLRPWAIDAVHKEGCHLGEDVTLASLERYYFWVGMSDSVRWFVKHCLVCQASKSNRRPPRWPLMSLPLPSRPGEMVAFDILGPLPTTTRGHKYVLLVVDLFSRHAEPYALTAAEKTAQGCATKLADDYCTRWGCPTFLLSDRGSEFTAAVAKDVYRLLGSKKRYTSSFHPQTNGCVERLNHTVCQMLSHVISAQQTDWDDHLLACVYAHNNHISRATGLAPMELHIGRYPRLPMTILGPPHSVWGLQ